MSNRNILIILLVLLAVIAGVFLYPQFGNEGGGEVRKTQGEIIEINQNTRTLKLKAETEEIDVSLLPDTALFDEKGNSANFAYFRKGYSVEATGRTVKNSFIPTEIKIIKKVDIFISNPRPNQEIASPLEIIGEATGTWYFEASFNARLLDGDGKEIGIAILTAQGEWMTEDFVPFTGKLIFTRPATEVGTLRFLSDNPSGLPENQKTFDVPVRFSKGEVIKVKAFFNNNEMDPEFSCNKVFPVGREVLRTQAVARAALEELLAGTTQVEQNRGFFTSINSGVKIQSLSIANGVAKVDFDETLERAVGGSCRVSAIRAQITETLKQFPTVQTVIISINGRTEDILQP